jgi:ABC-type glycerol-3-phosphate transport system substrate-binding protein
MKIALYALAAALALTAASVEETIKANLERFSAAAKAGDEKTLNMLLADDVTYSHSNAKMENKQEAVAALAKSKQTYTHSDIQIRTYGNTALVNTKINVQPNNVNLSALQVWVKKGNIWQMTARHTTRLQ